MITYFQVNRQYIAEVLCINKKDPIPVCNGQCFLKKKLDIAETGGNEEQNIPLQKTIDFPVFVISESAFRFSRDAQEHQSTTGYADRISSGHPDFIFRPPSLEA